MEWWMWLLALLGVIAVGVAAVFLGRWLYRQQARASLVKVLSRREAIAAAGRALYGVLQRLTTEDEVLERFASDPTSEDRKALEDIASRMRLTADELRTLALPKILWPVAEEMERVARLVAEQSGGVGRTLSFDDALDALGAIRIQAIRDEMSLVNQRLEPLLEEFHVDDPAVYGGGLYI